LKEKKKALNSEIRAKTVQIITDHGENLGEMSLREARAMASEKELDLMEIWKNWDVSIVKMLDYWKHLYRQKKQASKQKQQSKTPDLKTIRITFKIWDHDLEIRRKQAEKFWKANHPLKVTLMLRWRENHYSELAAEKMNSFVESISEIYKLEWTVRKHWNTFIAMLKTIK